MSPKKIEGDEVPHAHRLAAVSDSSLVLAELLVQRSMKFPLKIMTHLFMSGSDAAGNGALHTLLDTLVIIEPEQQDIQDRVLKPINKSANSSPRWFHLGVYDYPRISQTPTGETDYSAQDQRITAKGTSAVLKGLHRSARSAFQLGRRSDRIDALVRRARKIVVEKWQKVGGIPPELASVSKAEDFFTRIMGGEHGSGGVSQEGTRLEEKLLYSLYNGTLVRPSAIVDGIDRERTGSSSGGPRPAK